MLLGSHSTHLGCHCVSHQRGASGVGVILGVFVLLGCVGLDVMLGIGSGLTIISVVVEVFMCYT